MGTAVFLVDIVSHVGSGVDFDSVGKVGFGEGKGGSVVCSAFEVAEEVELFFVVAVVWAFAFSEYERYCLFDVVSKWEYIDGFSIDSAKIGTVGWG